MNKIIISCTLLFSMYGNAQTGIGTTSPKATLHVMGSPNSSSIVDGAILPNLTADQLKSKNALYNQDQKGAIVYVTTIPSTAETESNSKTYNVKSPGYYYFDGTKWKYFNTESVSAPKFFYMPSISLPVTPEMVTNMQNTNITYSNNIYTVDLYAIFKGQFENPIKSSNNIANTDDLGLNSFVLSRDAYEYHVIYADNNVFPHADINFVGGSGNEGKLTYKVNSNAIVQNSSFMNIVLKVK